MSFASGMKTIVVATDLDGRSEAALEYARKLATAYGARIVLAHGLDPMDYAAVDGVPGRVLKKLPEQARAVLEEMAREILYFSAAAGPMPETGVDLRSNLLAEPPASAGGYC